MKHRCGWVVKIVLVCLALMTVRGGLASGPRWVTGRPFYSTDGQPVHWQQTNLLYYTDPGGLSASVNHASADAIVAAAAGVWNVPVQVIGVGGVTPAAGKSVVFSVVDGAFTFAGCGATTCAAVTDSNGKASASGVATAAGSVSVMAADGAVTKTMTFSTTAKPDVMRMLSGPSVLSQRYLLNVAGSVNLRLC